jgi:hypothetical protein
MARKPLEERQPKRSWWRRVPSSKWWTSVIARSVETRIRRGSISCRHGRNNATASSRLQIAHNSSVRDRSGPGREDKPGVFDDARAARGKLSAKDHERIGH